MDTDEIAWFFPILNIAVLGIGAGITLAALNYGGRRYKALRLDWIVGTYTGHKLWGGV